MGNQQTGTSCTPLTQRTTIRLTFSVVVSYCTGLTSSGASHHSRRPLANVPTFIRFLPGLALVEVSSTFFVTCHVVQEHLQAPWSMEMYGWGDWERRCVPQALRTAGGRIVIFRPEMNAARMASGAAKMLMPAPPEELFLRAVQEVVRSNQALSRPHLHPRPLLPCTCRFSTGSS